MTTFTEALGHATERRQQLHMTRADLARAIEGKVGAVFTWEAATRDMPVSRLPRVATALHTRPSHLIADAERATTGYDTTPKWTLNLSLAATTPAADGLTRLKRWAHCRQHDRPIHITEHALQTLATVCDMPYHQLVTALVDQHVLTAIMSQKERHSA